MATYGNNRVSEFGDDLATKPKQILAWRFLDFNFIILHLHQSLILFGLVKLGIPTCALLAESTPIDDIDKNEIPVAAQLTILSSMKKRKLGHELRNGNSAMSKEESIQIKAGKVMEPLTALIQRENQQKWQENLPDEHLENYTTHFVVNFQALFKLALSWPALVILFVYFHKIWIYAFAPEEVGSGLDKFIDM
ncbi:hypothetical protein BDP27DRAFT_1361462 [Rhodocollybia butyracea]|uniref:Uncharacterized protein n=1 Tax=Rhodocollybia butyracea TaxID=206335 RepID=A0A9P5Q0Q2_9AGAR|nr:hypothetical protein BDP27DRAFT_1361462 [Rhodocollybia butyracea]